MAVCMSPNNTTFRHIAVIIKKAVNIEDQDHLHLILINRVATMQSLGAASEEADYLVYIGNKGAAAKVSNTNSKSANNNNNNSTTTNKDDKGSSNEFFSIHQKLKELFEEETSNKQTQPLQYLRPSSNLLHKLVERHNLNTLVCKLYPDYKGYSFGYKMGGDHLLETKHLPYSEDQLLGYIDNEELPPFIADILERSHPELYYSGCVIVEVQDHRQTSPNCLCDIRYVLLRPTTQSVINDVNSITLSGDWSYEEQLQLESQIVLATQAPLCLDPSPSVGLVKERFHHIRHALNTSSLRSTARRYSQLVVNRKRKLEELMSNSPSSNLARFIVRRSNNKRIQVNPVGGAASAAAAAQQQSVVRNPNAINKSHISIINNNNNNNNINNNNNNNNSNATKQQRQENEVPSSDYWNDVVRLAKSLERPKETNDFTPLLVEEYILEMERGNGKLYHVKLSIFQRPSNCEYLGQLYVDKEYKDGENNGATCRFSLGSRAQANRYIQQFSEIITMEGKKSVRITHKVPGQPARVTYTDGMKEREKMLRQQALLQAQVQQAIIQQQQQAGANTVSGLQTIPTGTNSVSQINVSNAATATVIKPKSTNITDLNNSVAAAILSPNSMLTINGLLSNGATAVIANGELTTTAGQISIPQLSSGNASVGNGGVGNSALSGNLNIVGNSNINVNIIGTSNCQQQQSSSLSLPSPNSTVSNNQQILHQPTQQPMSNSGSSSNNTSISSNNGNNNNNNTTSSLSKSSSSSSSSSASVLSSDPAISALAQNLMNSAQQYQLQKAAAAAAAAAQLSNSESCYSATTLLNNHIVGNINNNPNANSNIVNTALTNNNNAAILSLLNSGAVASSSGVSNSTLTTNSANNSNCVINNVINSSQHQQQQQRVNFNQKYLATKRMTLTNLLNSRTNVIGNSNSTAASSAAGSSGQNAAANQPVRLSLSALTNQLSSPPLAPQPTQQVQQQQRTASAGRLIQMLPRSVQTLTNVNVQSLANNGGVGNSNLSVINNSIVNSGSNNAQRVNIGNVQTISAGGNVQTIRRLATTSSVNQIDIGSNTSTTAPLVSTSNLVHSMPGLSALLAGTPSADNPGSSNSSGSALLDRLTTPPSYPSSSPKSCSASSVSVSLPVLTTNSPLSSPSPSQQQQSTSTSHSHSINFNIASLQANMPNKPSVLTNATVSGINANLLNSVQQQFHQQSGNTSVDNSVVVGNTTSNSSLSTTVGSALHERLSSPPLYPSSSPKSVSLATATNTPASSSSPSQQSSINFNITSLQGAMMSIPGLAVPISVSLNVSATPPHNVNVTSLPVSGSNLPTVSVGNANIATVAVTAANPAATMVFTNSTTAAQLLAAPTSKGANLRATSPAAAAACILGGQSIQLVGTLQRPRTIVSSKPTFAAARGMINTPRHMLKVTTANTVVQTDGSVTNQQGMTGQVLIPAATQQQLQLALQKQTAQRHLQQCLTQQQQQQQVQHQQQQQTSQVQPVSPAIAIKSQQHPPPRRRSTSSNTNK